MNTYGTWASIDKLPPEILTRIFLMTQEAGGNNTEKECLSRCLSQVASYWRKVTIATSALWTYIRVKTHQTNYDYPTMLLKRSKSHPIHLLITNTRDESLAINESIEEDSDDDPDVDLDDEGVVLEDFLTFLAKVGSRIYTLEMISQEYSFDLAVSLLSFLLDHGRPDMLNILHVKRAGAVASHYNYEIDWHKSGTDSPDHCESVLKSVNVLHLENVYFPWDSTIYQGLVDLRLQFTDACPLIEPSNFVGVLAASPTLTTLKIHGLQLECLDEWYGPITIALPCLEVIFLGRLSDVGWEFLLGTISLLDCSRNLHVGLEEFQPALDYQLEAFLHGSRLKTLSFADTIIEDSYFPILPCLTAVSSIDNLVLNCFAALDVYEMKSVKDALSEEGKWRLGLGRLPRLFLVSCCIVFDDLQAVIQLWGVQALHLERCTVEPPLNEGESAETIEGLRDRLMAAIPHLVCTVSDEVNISKWACCNMFD
ncbi:F-box-like protein [Ceratobasidium sp. AG-Ba]|nr:F-box-like protein [Ceratobasidium sp. AG-Ba]